MIGQPSETFPISGLCFHLFKEKKSEFVTCRFIRWPLKKEKTPSQIALKRWIFVPI